MLQKFPSKKMLVILVCDVIAFSLLVIWCLRPWVRILHSADGDLSPFDSNIACLCQSVEINNNKHVYCQSQVRKPTGSGVEWDEYSLIIGTVCRVQVFAWSSIVQSVCRWAFSLLVIWCLRPCIRILHSAEEDNLSPFDSNIVCLCQSIKINNNKHVIQEEGICIIHVQWKHKQSCTIAMRCKIIRYHQIISGISYLHGIQQVESGFKMVHVHLPCIWICRLWNGVHFVLASMF